MYVSSSVFEKDQFFRLMNMRTHLERSIFFIIIVCKICVIELQKQMKKQPKMHRLFHVTLLQDRL